MSGKESFTQRCICVDYLWMRTFSSQGRQERQGRAFSAEGIANTDVLKNILYMWNCNLLGPCWEIPLISAFYTLKFIERWPLLSERSSLIIWPLSLTPFFLLFALQHPTFSLWPHSPPLTYYTYYFEQKIPLQAICCSYSFHSPINTYLCLWRLRSPFLHTLWNKVKLFHCP